MKEDTFYSYIWKGKQRIVSTHSLNQRRLLGLHIFDSHTIFPKSYLLASHSFTLREVEYLYNGVRIYGMTVSFQYHWNQQKNENLKLVPQIIHWGQGTTNAACLKSCFLLSLSHTKQDGFWILTVLIISSWSWEVNLSQHHFIKLE